MAKEKSKGPGRPKRTDKNNITASTVEKGTKPGEKRKTYIVNIDLAEQIDELAHQDRTTVKNVVHEAFTNHVDKWVKDNGPLKVPKKK